MFSAFERGATFPCSCCGDLIVITPGTRPDKGVIVCPGCKCEHVHFQDPENVVHEEILQELDAEVEFSLEAKKFEKEFRQMEDLLK